jgi:hypothetical protein
MTKTLISPEKITSIQIIPSKESERFLWKKHSVENFILFRKLTPAHWWDDVMGKIVNTDYILLKNKYDIIEKDGTTVLMVRPHIEVRLVCGAYFTEYFKTMEELNSRVSDLEKNAGGKFIEVL